MVSNPGKGHLLGRDIVYQQLSPGSLLIGQHLEVDELEIGQNQQVLTVVSGMLRWQTPVIAGTATGQNTGSGAKVLSTVNAGNFTFKTITSGPGIRVTEQPNNILLELDMTTIASLPASTTIGFPSDGSWTNPIFPGAAAPAFTNWTNIYPASDAFDDLNSLLGLLLPAKPPVLNNINIIMAGGSNTRAGSNILLSGGVANNTGTTAIAPGTQIYRILNNIASTVISPEFGPGNNGILSSVINGTTDGSITLSRNDNSGNNISLTIVSNLDFPITSPGFWQSITSTISSTISSGINRFSLHHSAGNNSNDAFFVYDNLSITPVVLSILAVENPTNTYNYSSGIPHLSNGSIINITTTVSNLSSNTYLNTGIIQISSIDATLGNIVNIDPGMYGIPTILSISAPPFTTTVVPFIISTTTFTTTSIKVRGRNSRIDGAWLNDSFIINALSNIPNNRLDENNIQVTSGTIPVGASATASRILLPTGDTPLTVSADNLLISLWDSTIVLPAYEASVIGGVLKHDITNYSIGYIPSGPNYTTHNSIQYITWFFRRSTISNFSINITGTYSGLWVTMSGINFGTAPNGWLDMSQLYAGAGIPGLNGSAGCAIGNAAAGTSGNFSCTFGTETSSNANNNIIMVRIRLDIGNKITQLSF